MTAKKSITKGALTEWCTATATLSSGWILHCEREPHPLVNDGTYRPMEDQEFHRAHRGWYNHSEYEWGGIPDDDKIKCLSHGFRVNSNRNFIRVEDLCGRELYSHVSLQDGVTTLSGHLVSIKHSAEDGNPANRQTKIKIKRGEDSKTVTLEKGIELKLYRNV